MEASSAVELSQEAFQRALARYVDENKPDRHLREQMESWNFAWNSLPLAAVTEGLVQAAPFEPTHFLAGDLIWKGEYVKLKLRVFCTWEGTRKNGSIYFVCDVVEGEFSTAPDSSVSEKELKAAKHVHQKMIGRLQKDDYIKTLINSKNDRRAVFEASVSIKGTGELEERVCCEQNTAEAIRRSLFTTAESCLDVFDWIISLPFLPSIAHKGQVSVTTPLADRVKLRCLEEAACVECDQAEEEELVNELHISKKTKTK